MEIVYLSTSTIPSRTANSIHVMKMCQSFVRNGHEVVLVAPDKTKDLEEGVDDVYAHYGVEKCFEIVKLPWVKVKGQAYIYGCLAAIKAKKLKPDVVYSRNVPGGYVAAKLGLPVIIELHQPSEDSGKIVEWMFRGLAKSGNLEKIVVITYALKEYFESNHPVTKGKIQVAPDGAEPAPEHIQPIELPVGGNSLQVGYVGQLYRGKGMELIAELASFCPWANFHIVGGLDKDIQQWKSKCQDLENMVFHGYIQHNKIVQYIKSFDVVLLPNQRFVTSCGKKDSDIAPWTSPLKAFEYMAAGKPIISSDLPALREVLEHNVNALLCHPDNAGAWKQTLELLYEDQDLRTRLGNTAYKNFLEEYTWKARAERVLARVLHESSGL